MADPVAPTPDPVAVAPAAPAPAAPAPVAAAPVVAAPAPAAPALAPVIPPAAETILSAATKAPAVTPPPAGDTAAPTADAPAVAPVAPVPAPVYEAFKLPENVQLDEAQVGSFKEMLGKFETEHKADHAAMQALGQQMVDFYIAEQTRQEQAQIETWNRTIDGWKDQFIKDPELGGNRKDTTIANCGAMIEQYGGNADQITELRNAFRVTGMGNHPAMIRLLNNVAKVLSEGQPVPAIVPKAATTIPRAQRRYATTLNNNGAN